MGLDQHMAMTFLDDVEGVPAKIHCQREEMERPIHNGQEHVSLVSAD